MHLIWSSFIICAPFAMSGNATWIVSHTPGTRTSNSSCRCAVKVSKYEKMREWMKQLFVWKRDGDCIEWHLSAWLSVTGGLLDNITGTVAIIIVCSHKINGSAPVVQSFSVFHSYGCVQNPYFLLISIIIERAAFNCTKWSHVVQMLSFAENFVQWIYFYFSFSSNKTTRTH